MEFILSNSNLSFKSDNVNFLPIFTEGVSLSFGSNAISLLPICAESVNLSVSARQVLSLPIFSESVNLSISADNVSIALVFLSRAFLSLTIGNVDLDFIGATPVDDTDEEKKDKLKAAESAWLKTSSTLQGLYQSRTSLRLRKAEVEKRLEVLEESAPQDQVEVDLWCADYTEDLTGTVGTIEAAGDSSLSQLIVPGNRDGHLPTWKVQGDGTLRNTRHMTATEVFYNAAMLPGWQKWTPTYRIGTITALNGDSCDVSLEPVASDAKHINVNQAETLTGVGVDYMDCHGAAFEAGDTVVVQFTGQEWANPQVIGFEKNPKECLLKGIQVNDNGTRKILRQDVNGKWYVSESGGVKPVKYAGIKLGIFEETNKARFDNGGLQPFGAPASNTENPAQVMADIIRDTGIAYIEGYLPHDSEHYPVGYQTAAERIDRVPGVSSFAENLLAVPKIDDDGLPVAEKTGFELVDLWMHSPGHRANILGTEIPEFNDINRQTKLYLGTSEDTTYRYYVQNMCSISGSTSVQGTLDWKGTGGKCVSWRGNPSRYFRGMMATYLGGSNKRVGLAFYGGYRADIITKVTGTGLHDYEIEPYYNNAVYRGGKPYGVGAVTDVTIGAAIQSSKMVVVQARKIWSFEGPKDHLIICDLNGEKQEDLGIIWENDLYDSINYGMGYSDTIQRSPCYYPWLFNASGTEAVCIKAFLLGTPDESLEGYDKPLMEYHKVMLTVDIVTKNYTIVDHGKCEWQTHEYTEDATTKTETISIRSQVFDWKGDTLTTGELVIDRVQSFYSEESGLPVPQTPTNGVQYCRTDSSHSDSIDFSFSIDGSIKKSGSYSNTGTFAGWYESSSDPADDWRMWPDQHYKIDFANSAGGDSIDDLDMFASTFIKMVDLREGFYLSQIKTGWDISSDYSGWEYVLPEGAEMEEIYTPNRSNTAGDLIQSSSVAALNLNLQDNIYGTVHPVNPQAIELQGDFNLFLGDNRITGKMTANTDGKIAICSKSTAYNPADVVYLEDGTLTDFTSIPCNPICAV